jgi:hypothetical protein
MRPIIHLPRRRSANSQASKHDSAHFDDKGIWLAALSRRRPEGPSLSAQAEGLGRNAVARTGPEGAAHGDAIDERPLQGRCEPHIATQAFGLGCSRRPCGPTRLPLGRPFSTLFTFVSQRSETSPLATLPNFGARPTVFTVSAVCFVDLAIGSLDSQSGLGVLVVHPLRAQPLPEFILHFNSYAWHVQLILYVIIDRSDCRLEAHPVRARWSSCHSCFARDGLPLRGVKLRRPRYRAASAVSRVPFLARNSSFVPFLSNHND